MHGVSKSNVVAVPNVTPMIDVMMALLIIFMVMTPSLLSGVVAEPPVGEHLQARPEEEQDHTLAIDARARLFLDKRLISLDELGPALASLYPVGAENRVLYVKAHRELAYGSVNEAIDVARHSGVAVVGMITEQRPEPK